MTKIRLLFPQILESTSLRVELVTKIQIFQRLMKVLIQFFFDVGIKPEYFFSHFTTIENPLGLSLVLVTINREATIPGSHTTIGTFGNSASPLNF